MHADLLKKSAMTEEIRLLYTDCFNAAQRPCVSDIIQDGPCIDCNCVGCLGSPARGAGAWSRSTLTGPYYGRLM